MLDDTKLLNLKYRYFSHIVSDESQYLFSLREFSTDIEKFDIEFYKMIRVFDLITIFKNIIHYQYKKFKISRMSLYNKFEKEKKEIQKREYIGVLKYIVCVDIQNLIIEYLI